MDAFADIAHMQRVDKVRDLKKFKVLSPDFDIKDLAWVNDPLSLGKDRSKLYGAMDNIKHFPIMMRPINSIMGEMINRPMNLLVVSESAQARNEYFRMRTEMLMDHVMGSITQRVQQNLIRQGADPKSQDFQQQVQAKMPAEIEDYSEEDYVDIGEQVGSRILRNVMKRESLVGKFLDGFRHAVTCAKEFYHVYDAGHKVQVEHLSALEVFFHKSPSVQWTSKGQYVGFERFYTLSSIIDLKRESLTLEEIEHLEMRANPGHKKPKGGTGIQTIDYSTNVYRDFNGNKFADYDQHGVDEMIDAFHSGNTAYNYFSTSGLIPVVQAYWFSYKEVSFLTSYDDAGNEVVQMVDEFYEPDTDAGEYLEKMYVKQVYRGTKIDTDVYVDVEPDPNQYFDENDLDCASLPIEGCVYNAYHTYPIGLVDMMMMWQEVYNIVAHELKKDMKKAIGKVLFMSYDHIPKVAGFTKEKWLYWLREFGIAWVSDNKTRSTFSHYSAQDMSLAESIATKMQLLERIEMNCDSFAGFSQPRLSRTDQVDTARQSQQAQVTSVTQTEYYFFKHYELLQRVLTKAVEVEQMHLKYNPHSRALFDDAEQKFLDYDVDMISQTKLGIYISNSSDDLRKRDLLNSTIQAAVNNGADALDMSNILLADTQSEIKNIYGKLRKMRDQQAKANQQLEQSKVEAINKATQSRETIEREKMRSNEKIAYIKTFAFPDADNMKDENKDGTSDIFQYEENIRKAEADLMKQRNESNKNQLEAVKHRDDVQLRKEEINVERENMKNDEKIARINARNKNKPSK